MWMDELINILKETEIPFAYDHFAEGESPEPPFICYLLPGSNNFSADGKVYFKANEVHIELYTDFKDLTVEQKLEAVLDEHGIFYNKSETWIESEKLYEVLYIFETEV
nr:MAG TPA: tail completion protein [Caudoviricetes sp.]